VPAPVPDIRIRICNDRQVNEHGDFVLYWMVAARRTRSNFALQRAVEWARSLKRPLVVLEALRVGDPGASDRFHAFILQGMADNAERLAGSAATYFPYVEPAPGASKGLLEALSRHAAVIVTDDFPAFFLPRMVAAVAARVEVPLEAVDSNGLLPLRATDRVYPSAYAFRRFLQKSLKEHLLQLPAEQPLGMLPGQGLPQLPDEITARWPPVSPTPLAAMAASLAALPIDHAVPAVGAQGGANAAEAALAEFLDRKLSRYRDERNQPDEAVTSGLSPYLHFGHISTHDVFQALMTRERWTTRSVSPKASGQRDGWWGASPAAEAFLDELVTWRELGYTMCHLQPDFDQYESLPAWARATLDMHAADRRAHLYSLEQFEAARTHDPLWNAAQTELVREGRIHNYLRMLWGKKILEWSPSPRAALDVMIELNNKYALDGRDPNSYSGIFWVLGRYDRPWAPERPIFGSIRYMSSENTARKLHVREYVRRYTP